MSGRARRGTAGARASGWNYNERVTPLVREALQRYRARLDRELPGRVRRLALYGSHARGEAHEESDVDVLVVLSEATHRERARAIDIGGEIGIELTLAVAPVVLTQAEWDEMVRRERRFVSEIEHDGVEA